MKEWTFICLVFWLLSDHGSTARRALVNCSNLSYRVTSFSALLSCWNVRAHIHPVTSRGWLPVMLAALALRAHAWGRVSARDVNRLYFCRRLMPGAASVKLNF